MKVIEKHIVPAIDEDIRLQEYASTIFDSISSRSGIKKAIKNQLVLINGQAAQTSDWIKEGQVIELLQKEIRSKKIFHLKLEVAFEDNFIAVVHKVSGYPTNGNYFKTIENALPYNLQPSSEQDALPYPVAVHRLDNPTSGLLIVAKTKPAQLQLHEDFQQRKISKSYVAIVSGILAEKGMYNSAVDQKSAETHFQRLDQFSNKKENYSLVELFPITGRTHQLRVHLSENGFPIVGDEAYGSSVKVGKGIMLSAHSLLFNHPVTFQPLQIKSALPKKFLKFIEHVKDDRRNSEGS